MERRLNALLLRHARLDRQLRQEVRRPFRDGLTIPRLKRLKLRVKDEMALLKGVMRTVRMPDAPRQGPM